MQRQRVEGQVNSSTKYLGLTLAHPFIAGASPITHDLDDVKRLEDGGVAAIVLHTLFENQMTMADAGRIHHVDSGAENIASILAPHAPADRYAFAAEGYMEHIYRVKTSVAIPVIGSLNGVTPEAWLRAARGMEQAGADALELNMCAIVADPADSSGAIEARIRDVTADLKSSVSIPVAVKLSPYFTGVAHLAGQLDRAAADGLVLFNRFYQPDIDLTTMKATPRIELSTSADLLLRLQWIGLLHHRVRASLALTGGVATVEDGVKAILAGAHAVQLVSAILRNGPAFFDVMRSGLLRWMEFGEFATIDEIRGRARFEDCGDAIELTRAASLLALQSRPTIH